MKRYNSCVNGAAHPIFMLNRHSALWTASEVPSRCPREITTAPERQELFFLKQLSSRLFHSIIWRLPPPTGQAEPAIGVATVEGDRGDEEVEAGGALVLRLKGLCQFAWTQHNIKKRRLKRKSHRGALFSLPPSQTQTCKPAVLLIATAEPPA